MAAYVKYDIFIEDVWNKIHDLFGTTEEIRVVFHSDAPVVATDTTLANLTEVTGTGYTAGGGDTQNDSTRTGATLTLTGVDFVWTATAADWTSGRYVSIYNNTPAPNPLIASWDYGSAFALGNGETFTVDFGASIHTAA